MHPRLDISHKFPPLPYPYKVEMDAHGRLWYTVRTTEGMLPCFYHQPDDGFCTQLLCYSWGMSEEEVLLWVLKFGDNLPKHVDQL